MEITVKVKENVSVDSGLWPEFVFTGKLIKFWPTMVELLHPDYCQMVFNYSDIESINFEQ